MTDPATRDGAGEILALDREARELVLKRGPKLDDVPLPEALIPEGVVPARTTRRTRSMRIGRSLLAGDRRYPAVESILRREPFDRDVQTTTSTRDSSARSTGGTSSSRARRARARRGRSAG